MMNYSIANRGEVGLEPGTSTKIHSAAQIMKKGLQTPSSTMPKSLGKNKQEKEIVSAMVRLNTQGLNVPVKFEELKKLPIIPNTGARLKKKGKTDLYAQNNFFSLNEEDELLDEDSEDERG